ADALRLAAPGNLMLAGHEALISVPYSKFFAEIIPLGNCVRSLMDNNNPLAVEPKRENDIAN
ncbi:MAG TPA: hypothetical protein DEA80_02885, partial [Afipia sp.]|nr:hypothetical protein [Afipia sp.]